MPDESPLPDEFPLPLWQSHKQVRASKIQSISGPGVKEGQPVEGCALHLECGVTVHVDEHYMRKHCPESGGYYVRYPDGYKSWSPAAAFEDGYSQIE